MSLRSRLVLTVTVVAFLALLVADVVTYTSLRTVLYDQVDSSLLTAHVAIERILTGEATSSPSPGAGGSERPATGPPSRSGPTGATAPSSARSGTAPEDGGAVARDGEGGEQPPKGRALCESNASGGDAPGAFVEVRTASGQVVDGDLCPAYVPGGAAFVPELPARITGFSRQGPDLTTYLSAPATVSSGPQFRVRVSVLAAGPLAGDQLVVALPLRSQDNTLGRLIWIELAVTAGALAVALALGWWLVHRELLPLRRVESTAEAIAGGDFGNRVPGERASTEVGRVALALNSMLSAIERAFAERDATEAELRASEERLRRFVGDASHELRTPIAAVSAYAQLIERRDGHEEDVPRLLRGIAVESARMTRLVEDLLLLARLDEHRPLRREPVELVDLAAGAIETARAVGPGWPVLLEASDAVEVPGDEVQLRQVLDNLLANVRAHTPPGTATTVRVRGEGPEAVVEVADAGPGLAPEQAALVFERFFRADPSRARSTGGSGLGLAIARAIAEAHGGSASFAATPGGGATFSLRLPLDAQPARKQAGDAGGGGPT